MLPSCFNNFVLSISRFLKNVRSITLLASFLPSKEGPQIATRIIIHSVPIHVHPMNYASQLLFFNLKKIRMELYTTLEQENRRFFPFKVGRCSGAWKMLETFQEVGLIDWSHPNKTSQNRVHQRLSAFHGIIHHFHPNTNVRSILTLHGGQSEPFHLTRNESKRQYKMASLHWRDDPKEEGVLSCTNTTMMNEK